MKHHYPRNKEIFKDIIFILIGLMTFFAERELSAQALSDSVHQLKPVKVTASRLENYTVGLNHYEIDSVNLSYFSESSLEKIIGSLTPIYVKSYGGGSLSTMSMRGTASHHTGLYWNGLNLNPSNTGMSDLSLYPVSLFESVEILNGGSSSLFGSGNIGGNIHMKNKAVFKKLSEFLVGLGYGSFDNKNMEAGLKISNKNWYVRTKIFGGYIENDFKYTNSLFPEPYEENLKNARIKKYGAISDIYRKINNDQIVYLGLWYTYHNRQIPPTLTMTESNAWQVDKNFKSVIRYDKYFNSAMINVKSAYFIDYLNYVDDLFNIDSEIKVRTIISEIEWKYQFRDDLNISGGVNSTYASAEIEFYGEREDQTSFDFYFMMIYGFKFIPWKVNVNIQQELIKGYDVPFTPSIGLEGKIFRFIYGKMNLSRNYSLPSMNDRYWIPGGNTDLNPENSINEEVSLILKNDENSENVNADFTATFFNLLIDDWIQWVPTSQGFWKAENVKSVKSRGFECRSSLKFLIRKSVVSLNLAYNYTKSINNKSSLQDDESINKQLIYVPVHKASGQIFLQSPYISFMYSQNFVGERFILRDNTESLPSYCVADVGISKDINIKKYKLQLHFDIQNIYGSEYQSVAYRPMPGRSYNIRLKFIYKKN